MDREKRNKEDGYEADGEKESVKSLDEEVMYYLRTGEWTGLRKKWRKGGQGRRKRRSCFL